MGNASGFAVMPVACRSPSTLLTRAMGRVALAIDRSSLVLVPMRHQQRQRRFSALGRPSSEHAGRHRARRVTACRRRELRWQSDRMRRFLAASARPVVSAVSPCVSDKP